MYAVGTSTQSADAAGTLEGYINSGVLSTTRKLLDVILVESRQIEIRGLPGVQYQMHGTLLQSQILVGYVLTFIATEHHYVSVAGWTTESRSQSNMDAPSLADAAQTGAKIFPD